ncbi:MAG: hypothetical protein L6Q54_13215 [Leptospiraceae bacterium]|nr:hypothetical protein [Leptospiraceae bacterium]MCK6382194.1 hypothetical protein [Leptospiraceae bacterium]NUM42772.1 hypothetical protein [Leptospiraceae bacterium]
MIIQSAFSIFLIFITIGCSPKKSFPDSISSNAKFDKKTNLYTAIENNKRLAWYDTGELYSSCKVNPLGINDGECFQYTKSKSVLSFGNFKNGQRDGLWVWNFLNGKPYCKQYFTYGKKRVFWIQTDIWGNEDGLYERFYENGNLEEKGYYDSGYKTGNWEKYFIDGKKEYSGSYHKDLKIKEWIFYYPSGLVEAKETYDITGKLVHRITYFENGQIQCRILGEEKKSECFGNKG